MRTKQLIFLTIFLPTISIGQTISDSLLGTFYNKTLAIYFPDTTAHKDQVKFGCIILQTDLDTSKLIKRSGLNKFKFISSKTNKKSVLDKPFKKNKDRNIYWINQNAFGTDTIDINIGGWTIEEVNKHNLLLGAWCGGTMGHIPNARFVYNKITNSWSLISGQEILNQELLKLKKN